MNLAHLNPAAFLLGHGVENPVDGIHGDEAYLYEVKIPRRVEFDEPWVWTVPVSFPWWEGLTDGAFSSAPTANSKGRWTASSR